MDRVINNNCMNINGNINNTSIFIVFNVNTSCIVINVNNIYIDTYVDNICVDN